MSERRSRDFHFNVNVRVDGGSKSAMANNEDSFLRAMKIQERKREKKESEKLADEKNIATSPPSENETPAVREEATPSAESHGESAPSADGHGEPAPTESAAGAVHVPPATSAESPPAAAEPASGGAATPPSSSASSSPSPSPQKDFTAEEKAAMLKRAKAHATEVQARKNK